MSGIDLRFVDLGLDVRPPEDLIAQVSAQAKPIALVSGPGAAELSRWSVFAMLPVTTTSELLVAEAFARAAEPGAPPFTLDDTIPFLTGAIGYVSYDLGWAFAARPRTPRPHPLGLPHAWFGLYDAALLRDRRDGRTWMVHRESADASVAALRALAKDAMPSVELAGRLEGGLIPGVPPATHKARIREARGLIAEGEVYQVNLTYPLEGRFVGDARAAFGRLCRSAPPFAACLTLGETHAIVSASPECFIALDEPSQIVRTYPIKGTRGRGRTSEEDGREARALLASAKDRAEHLMIVDLLRNDLGRVAAANGVRVPDLCYIESFPTVHHLTSRVEARLPGGTPPARLFRSLFPGGSITGAPKLRAMEIIDRLEGSARGVYTGSVVAWGPQGMMASIAIRTGEIVDGNIRIGVGGGIVFDSDPEAEWEETQLKAQAITEALTG